MAKGPRFANEGVTFNIAIDAVLEVMSAGYAMSDSMKDPRYIDAIVDEAFEKVDDIFNTQAAATAATGTLAHMYEWGTVGINKGKTNIRLNPMNPNARLWQTFTEGAGLDRTIWYAFKPSFATVPKPTTANSGMNQEVIDKMRDHVFTRKAEVLEQGETVTITPKHSKFLLIPAYEQNLDYDYMRPHDYTRGYMLTPGPIQIDHANSQYYGNFTAFWTQFWFNEGEELLEADVNRQVLSDYEPEFRATRTSGTLRPILTVNARGQIQSNSKKKQAKVIRKAKLRRAR